MFSTSAWAQGLSKVKRARWRRVRANQLASHPLCQWRGCLGVAHEVDHIQNLNEHPDIDPYDYSNLQSLCVAHHATKTGIEGDRASRRARAKRIDGVRQRD